MVQKNGLISARMIGQSEVAGWVAFVLVALGTIFCLPSLIPVAPTLSDSYLFGFSNRAGVMLLLFFLALAAFLSKSLKFHLLDLPPATSVTRNDVWGAMVIFGTAWAVMYRFTFGLGGFGESLYLIDRLKLLANGQTPYKDFEFVYGPLFLYGPRALMYFGLSAEQGYYAFWLCGLLTGVWMLAQILKLLDLPGVRKREAFWLLCLFALPSVLSTGLNYTLVRFLPASYFALLVERAYSNTRWSGRGRATLIALASTILILLISPEMGIAYAAGTIGYFSLFWVIRASSRDGQTLACFFMLLVGEAAIFWEASRFHLFDTLKAFGTGAYSFPLIPAGHILLFFFGCVVVTLYIADCLRSGSHGSGPLMVLAVSTPTLFAALGRCDPGHVGFAAIGLVLTATLLISTMPLTWSVYRVLFLFFFILIPAASLLRGYQSLIVKVVIADLFEARQTPMIAKAEALIERDMNRKLGPVKTRSKLDLVHASTHIPASIDFRKTYPASSGTLVAPFGYSPGQSGNVPSSAVETGFFYKLVNVFTPAAIQRKIGELSNHPERELLLPSDFEDQCKVDPSAEQKTIRFLFLYPYRGRVRHSESVLAPLCSYIQRNYHLIEKAEPQGYGYEVWKTGTMQNRQ